MNFARISKSLASVGVVGALAAGAVAAIAPAADAATGNNTYTCALPTQGDVAFPVTASVPNLDSVGTLPAGFAVAESLLNLGSDVPAMDLTIGVPSALLPMMTTLGVTGLSSPDMGFGFGSQSVPVTGLAMTGLTVDDAGNGVLSATGTNGAFNAPRAGTYPITMPSKFTMVLATTALGDLPIPCSTETPGTLKSITVTKNSSVTNAKPATTPFHHTKVAKMNATVTAANHTPTGKVLVKQGTKTLGTGILKAGKAVVSLGNLSVGKHNLVVLYNGDGYTTSSKKAITVKVAR